MINNEYYKNKKVLVTGGTGFIGSRLAERLSIEEKADVTVLVNSWFKATWVSRSPVKLVQANITDAKEIEQLVAGNEIVFHCVGVGGTTEQCMSINYEGTKNVLNACKKQGVKRIVYLSSVVVNGIRTFEGMDETAPYVYTGSPYADSKIEAEKYFFDFIKTQHLEGSVIRPTFVWGPVSPYYTIEPVKQMRNGSFLMVDKGIGSCNAVYVDNVVDISILCGYHTGAVGEAFFVTDGEKKDWKDFWGRFAKMIGKDISEFASVPSKDNFTRKISKLGMRLLITTQNGLTEIINKLNKTMPGLTRYLFKAPRKLVKMLLAFLGRLTPEMDEVSLQSYSSAGFISLAKSKNLLGYSPRVSIEQGMKECEIWLGDQNYI